MGDNVKKKKIKKPEIKRQLVYVFHNKQHSLDLFVNAWDANDAYDKFDQCAFKVRTDWTLMVELKHQPI